MKRFFCLMLTFFCLCSFRASAESAPELIVGEIVAPSSGWTTMWEVTGDWPQFMVGASFAWAIDTYGNDVNVAVIDTGCSNHENLNGTLKGGYNYYDNNEDYSDGHGHGTHVCGIVASSLTKKVCGVAPKVNLYALKCANDEGELKSFGDVERAIYDAVDKYHCRVINLSLGGSDNDAGVGKAIDHAIENDVLVVAAVGNAGSTVKFYPAAYPGVVGVGAVNIEKERASFSQYNSSVYVVAPGEAVTSLNGTNDTLMMSGTSQAAPFVTAAAAVMFSLDPAITAEEVKMLIKDTAEDLGSEGYDYYYGNGLLDLEAMITKRLEGKSAYVSPINDGVATVVNMGDAPLVAFGLWANYSGTTMGGAFGTQIEVGAGEKQTIKVGNSRFFLFRDLTSLQPLTAVRSSEE